VGCRARLLAHEFEVVCGSRCDDYPAATVYLSLLTSVLSVHKLDANLEERQKI
jgi:hypothetical protein